MTGSSSAKESCRSTLLKRWMLTEMRWKRNVASLSSPDTDEMRRPSAFRNSMSEVLSRVPMFSTATGWRLKVNVFDRFALSSLLRDQTRLSCSHSDVRIGQCTHNRDISNQRLTILPRVQWKPVLLLLLLLFTVTFVFDFSVHSFHCIYGHVFRLYWRLLGIYAVPTLKTTTTTNELLIATVASLRWRQQTKHWSSLCLPLNK